MPKNDTPDKALVERLVEAIHPAWFSSDYNHQQCVKAVRAALASNSPVVGEDGCFCERMKAEGYREVCGWCISNKDWSRKPTPAEQPTPTDTADRRAVMDIAHELFIPFQAGPGEGIADVVDRVTPILASLIAGPREGFIMVPVEPTEAMIEAGRVDIQCRRDCRVSKLTGKQVWSAMIAAAAGEA